MSARPMAMDEPRDASDDRRAPGSNAEALDDLPPRKRARVMTERLRIRTTKRNRRLLRIAAARLGTTESALASKALEKGLSELLAGIPNHAHLRGDDASLQIGGDRTGGRPDRRATLGDRRRKPRV